MDGREHDTFQSDAEAISLETVWFAMDRRMRGKVFEEFDLLKARDEGRYFLAEARIKDGQRFCELRVDKLSGAVHAHDCGSAH